MVGNAEGDFGAEGALGYACDEKCGDAKCPACGRGQLKVTVSDLLLIALEKCFATCSAVDLALKAVMLGVQKTQQ